MSGHSKWAQIKRQKGAADVKRGLTFTKLSNAISITVKESGGIGDPDQNFKLRLLIDKAKAVNMPKDTIARAIQKGQGKGAAGIDLQEAVYEGFGPDHVALIIEVTTDNKARTNSEIKNIFDKNGATLATPGSVSYLFSGKGLIYVKKDDKTLEDIFLVAADAGAQDVEEAGGEVLVYTKPNELAQVKNHLTEAGLSVQEFELSRKPTVTVLIDNKETAAKILSLIEKIESLDDVQKVYANFNIAEEALNI